MAEEKSWKSRSLRFLFFHAAAVGLTAWFAPGIFHAAHTWLVAKIAAVKGGLVAYAATDPTVSGGAVSGLTDAVKSTAKFLSGGASAGGLVAPDVLGMG